MKEINTNITVFEDKAVRRTWHNEQWYVSIIDIVAILSQSSNPRRYWSDLKIKLTKEGYSELYENIVQLKMLSKDGKTYSTDASNLMAAFRIIQSIPSKKAEPFKQWLARVGQERIEEIQDPEKAIVRAKNTYTAKGYEDDWIAKRMRGINVRNTLTDEWKDRGAKEGLEFAILTNEIYKGTFEKTAREIKKFKSLGHEDNPRDHMNELEIILTMLGEATTTRITKTNNSKGLPKLQKDARKGGQIAGNTRKEIEAETREKVMKKDNFLKNKKQIEKNRNFISSESLV